MKSLRWWGRCVITCAAVLVASFQPALAKTVRATVVDMLTSEYGGVRVFATPDMVTIHMQGGGEIHACAPSWKVVCSNPNDKTILEMSLDEWQNTGIPSLVDVRKIHFSSPSTRLSNTEFLNRKALKITAPFSPLASSAIPRTRTTSKTVKGLDIDSKPDTISMIGTELHLGKNATAIVQGLLKSPPQIGFPLRVMVQYFKTGYAGMTVDTNSITTKECPTTFFEYPRGYKNKVKTPEVALTGRQLESFFEGMLETQK